MEEPPAKVTKFEMESQYLEGEVMEEGQEEWLSEGILTDDDYNPASQQTEPDHNDSNVTSQDETMNSASADDSQNQLDVPSQEMVTNASNIEETLNNLENSETGNQNSELPEELNAFLIRKVDGKIIGSEAPKKDSDVDESVKQSDDDGNDTDDLLRVLGDGDQSSKHVKKEKVMINTEHRDFSDGDDNFVFEDSDNLRRVKNFNVAKMVLGRAPAKKAEPEDDQTDCSSDEADTIKKIFTLKNKSTSATPQITTTVKPGNLTITPLKTKEQPKNRVIKQLIQVPVPKTRVHPLPEKVIEVKRPVNTSRRQYVNKRVVQGTSLLKTNASVKRTQPDGNKIKEEFSRDHNVELDKNYTQKSKERKSNQQRLMCPEIMDEEVPTDAESESEEESMYSELPSSESDGEDRFTLDIRAERAGDYIPLLGDRAYQLLSEERSRVKARLDTLRKRLTALTDSGRELADQLTEATSTVAELDALLKAA